MHLRSIIAAGKHAALQNPYHLAAAFLLLLAGVVFYVPYLSELPSGIHVWAQADRLALAINYYDYGFHFLKPRTYALQSIGGITGVEFPLPAYLAALGGALFGRSSIVACFRALDVIVALIGYFYLFRLIYERTGHFVAGLVPAAFLLASPTFAYYAGNFVPDPFSLSLSFVGYYYWFRFFERRQFSDLRWTMALLILAGLIKTTTAMHFGAIVGITVLWAFLDTELMRVRHRWELLAWAVSGVGVLGASFLYSQHLNETYTSWQFITKPAPLADTEAWHAMLQTIRKVWLAEYGIPTHYRVLAACSALFLLFLWPNLRRNLPITLLLLASVVIAYVFVRIMGEKLQVHDYYAICSFGPPALLLLILGLLNIGRFSGITRYVTSVGLGVLVVFFALNGYKRLQRRMSDEYPPFSPYTFLWMRGGAAELQKANVPATATVLVLEAAVNVGQVYFDRRGISWQPQNLAALQSADFLNTMAADSLEYLIMPPESYAQLAPIHAAMAQDFELVAEKPGIVLRRRDMKRPW